METAGEDAPKIDPAISDTRVMYPLAKKRVILLEGVVRELLLSIDPDCIRLEHGNDLGEAVRQAEKVWSDKSWMKR